MFIITAQNKTNNLMTLFYAPNGSWVMIEIQQGSQKVKGHWYIPILGIKGR